MSDAASTALTVFFWVLVFFAVIFVLMGLVVLQFMISVRRRYRRLNRAVNHAVQNNLATIYFDQDQLSPDETRQVRDYLRVRKEQQARGHETVDRAREYGNDLGTS